MATGHSRSLATCSTSKRTPCARFAINSTMVSRGGRLLLGCRGRVVVSGIGKSGHVARKLAATLASTGTPAFFVHPAEASHGDLGMVTADDIFVALSNSGETDELVAILPLVKRLGAKLIAMTGRPSPVSRNWPTST